MTDFDDFFLLRANVKNITLGPFKSGVYFAMYIFLLGSIISMQVIKWSSGKLFTNGFNYVPTYKQGQITIQPFIWSKAKFALFVQ
jgi:hypothetical protein